MAIWSAIYYMAYPLGGAAIMVLLWGLRTRKLDDHPICRRCKYDLFGLPADRRQCPECGAELTGVQAVTIGHRTRHPPTIIAGLAAALFALGLGRLADWRYDLIVSRPARFHQAVMGGNLAEVDRLLSKDPSLAEGRQRDHPSYHFSSSYTPLQTALVFSQNPKVVQRILDENPDLDEPSSHGETALHLAAKGLQLADAEQLLDLGADVDPVDDEGMTPLHEAARTDAVGGLVRMLLRHGADPNRPVAGAGVGRGKTALHLAAERRNQAAVTVLLDAGVRINAQDALGRTPLHLAMARQNQDMSKLLVKRGAYLVTKDADGNIPGQDQLENESAALIWWGRIVEAHDQNELAALDALLDRAPQALLFRTSYSPSTMLHRAVSEGRLDVMDYLLKRGVASNISGEEGRTPLHLACGRPDRVECARRLIEAGADIDVRDKHGQTPLHWAASSHIREALALLIDSGADLTARDVSDATVLDAAFQKGFHVDEGIKTLTELRQAGHPATVLCAAATGNLARLEQLVRDDPELLGKPYTRSGVRPLHAAVLAGQQQVVRWLLDQGVEIDALTSETGPGPPGQSPLFMALSHSQTDTAILLIERGADVNREDPHGYRAAHAVIQWDRDPRLLEALLAHGADPTLTSRNVTAVQLALDSKSRQRDRYLEVLRDAGYAQAAPPSASTPAP